MRFLLSTFSCCNCLKKNQATATRKCWKKLLKVKTTTKAFELWLFIEIAVKSRVGKERKKERKLFRETELPQATFSSPKSRAACSAPFSFLTTTVRSVCWHFTLNMGKITWTRAVKCIENERLFYSSARVFLSTFGFWPASLMGLLNFHMVHWAARWARPS